MRTIQYKVPYEKMISRLPALFAYLDIDKEGNTALHYATDSNDGCYGKIVENIKLPDKVNLVIDDEIILKSGETYTFRTIISYYYQYKDILPNDDVFKQFIEKAIGKVDIPDSDRYDENGKEYVAMPKFVYLCDVKRLYNEVVKMSKTCEFYNKNVDKFGKDKHMCCLCEKYAEMGGDKFRNILKGYLQMAMDIALEYYGYAESAEKGMTLDFDVDLLSSYKDMGIMTAYLPQWIPFKEYYEGDRVVFDNNVYIRNSEESIDNSFFDLNCFDIVNSNLYRCDDEGKIQSVQKIENIQSTTDSKLMGLRRFATFFNIDNEQEKPQDGYDWMFYYRKGYVKNIKTLTDNLGNILDFDGNTGTNGNTLCAYGDVIEDIKKGEDNTIIFQYQLGVHLVGTLDSTYTDEDNNVYYSWKDFRVDTNWKDVIKYEETYNYTSNSDLDKLINNNFIIEGFEPFEFSKYILGDYDGGALKFYKFEFITYDKMVNVTKNVNNQDIHINSIVSNFTMDKSDNSIFDGMNVVWDDEIENYVVSGTPLFKYDYFNGVTYAPSYEINVNITRGSNACFDKHIALSEIKTMEDLESYHNGSFFNIKNE